MRATRVAFAIGVAFVATMATGLPAADLRNVLTDYTITSWSQREGLLAGNVWALAQDHDGYLWVGSDGGLMRFDGVRFTPWPVIGEKQHDKPVRALHVSRDGSVWVGYGDAGGIARIRTDRTRIYRESDGVAGAAIMVIIEDAAGTVWAGGEKGLLRFDQDRWQQWGSSEGLPDTAVYSAFVDRSGGFYVGAATGIFRRAADERRFSQLEVIDADNEEPTEPGLVGRFRRSLTEDASGRVPATVGGFPRSFVEDASGRVLVNDWTTGLHVVGAVQPRYGLAGSRARLSAARRSPPESVGGDDRPGTLADQAASSKWVPDRAGELVDRAAQRRGRRAARRQGWQHLGGHDRRPQPLDTSSSQSAHRSGSGRRHRGDAGPQCLDGHRRRSEPLLAGRSRIAIAACRHRWRAAAHHACRRARHDLDCHRAVLCPHACRYVAAVTPANRRTRDHRAHLVGLRWGRLALRSRNRNWCAGTVAR